MLCQNWWNHPNPQHSLDFQSNFWVESKTTVTREKPKAWLAYSICVNIFRPQEVQNWSSFEGENWKITIPFLDIGQLWHVFLRWFWKLLKLLGKLRVWLAPAKNVDVSRLKAEIRSWLNLKYFYTFLQLHFCFDRNLNSSLFLSKKLSRV